MSTDLKFPQVELLSIGEGLRSAEHPLSPGEEYRSIVPHFSHFTLTPSQLGVRRRKQKGGSPLLPAVHRVGEMPRCAE